MSFSALGCPPGKRHDERAAPAAANRCESLGEMAVSSLRFSVRIKAALSSERNVRGPPKNTTFPLMGLPQARPLMVWFTTAWKMEAAKSGLVAPSLIRGWISLLANTPQRAAIGYMAL